MGKRQLADLPCILGSRAPDDLLPVGIQIIQGDRLGFRRGRQKIANRRKSDACDTAWFQVGQGPYQSSARHIPQVHASVKPAHCQAAAIRGEADIESTHRTVGERDQGAAAGQLPEIAPFPTAQVFLAGRRPVPVQQPSCPAEIIQIERLLGEIHVRGVEQSPRLLLALRGLARLGVGALPFGFGALALGFGLGLFFLRFEPLLLLTRARGFGFPLCFSSRKRLPCADGNPDQKRDRHRRCGREHQLVAAKGFLKSVSDRRRTCDHGFVVQMPLDVHRQSVGRLVTPRAIFLQALHHDPVEIAAQQRDGLLDS